MPNGFGGRGFGRGGWGFGFRGSSPPWPFVGVGRGGLPRCGYFLSGAAGMPISPGHLYCGVPRSTPYYGDAAPTPGPIPGAPATEAYPFAPQMTPEQELDILRSQAEMLRGQLEQMDARMRELEVEQ